MTGCRIKKLICLLLTLITVICSIAAASRLLRSKESASRYASFFTEKNDIDVLFIGSSHARHGFLPMELWNDHGITAYNLSGNGNTIPVSYWTLVNALDYHTPKVVVFDIYDIWPGRMISESVGQVHVALDAFPITTNKVKMIRDLFADREITDGDGNNVYQNRWDFFFDLRLYHSRWEELEERDFYSQMKIDEESRVWKGALPLADIVEREKKTYDTPVSELYYDVIAKEYLEKTIDLCKKNDIGLILVNTGYDCRDEAKYFADSVEEIAKNKEVTYLDFTQEDIIDFRTDLNTTWPNTHVNISGARKFTSYIAKELLAEYELHDHRNETGYEKWNEDEEKYIDSKRTYLTEQTDIDNFLLFLTCQDASVIFLIGDPDTVCTSKTLSLFENIGIDKKYVKSGRIVALKPGTNRVSCIETVSDQEIAELPSFANVRVEWGKDCQTASVNNEELARFDGENKGIRIIVLHDNKMTDIAQFD